jgi:hypothetical protein
MSSIGALWVIHPTEIKSTPVAAMSGAVIGLMRPDASAGAMDSASEQPASWSGIRTVFHGIEQLCPLGHEMHAGHDDDLRLYRSPPAPAPGYRLRCRQHSGRFQASDIVRENHGVAAAFQSENRVDVLGKDLPFHSWDDMTNPLMQRSVSRDSLTQVEVAPPWKVGFRGLADRPTSDRLGASADWRLTRCWVVFCPPTLEQLTGAKQTLTLDQFLELSTPSGARHQQLKVHRPRAARSERE